MNLQQGQVSDLLGYTLDKIELHGNDQLYFFTDEGEVYKMYHAQSCCEDVLIEDIEGDLNDIVGEPLLRAEEVTEEDESEWGSITWTFYKFSTIKGSAVIRWLGESNGYYSERVDFVKVLDGF